MVKYVIFYLVHVKFLSFYFSLKNHPDVCDKRKSTCYCINVNTNVLRRSVQIISLTNLAEQ